MDKLIVKTTTLNNTLETLKTRFKYYNKKKDTFYSSLCGASSELNLSQFLNRINQNYTCLAKNTFNLISFLEDYVGDLEAVEKSFSKLENATFKSSTIKSFCLSNSNLNNQIKIDDVNLFQVNQSKNLLENSKYKVQENLFNSFDKRAKIDSSLESRMYIQLINKEDLSSITWREYTILVKGYKKELQNELKVYNDLLEIANEEIDKYSEAKKVIDSWQREIEDNERFFEQHILTVAESYQTIASYNNPKETALLEVELKEKFGISLTEFNSMSKSELIDLIILKDKEEQEKKSEIEKSKEYLEGYIKQETEFSSLVEFKTYMEEMEQDRLISTSAIRVAQNYLDCAEYTFLPLLKEYQSFQENSSSPLESYKNMSSFEKGLIKSSSGVFTNNLTNFDKLDALARASDINPELGKMYNYIFTTEGEESATLYLKNMEASINQINGQHNAEKFLSSLKDEKDIGDALENHVKTLGKGLWEGLESFGEGIEAWITSSTIYSENEYEAMYILEAMQGMPKANFDHYRDVLDKINIEGVPDSSPLDRNNSNVDLDALKTASIVDPNLANVYNYLYSTEGEASATKYLEEMLPTIEAINAYQEGEHKNYNWALKHNFQITQSMGNMLPSIAISLILTPAAGASVAGTVGSISMGVSAGGKSYHNALVEGHDKPRSVFYGVLSGISEASLQKMVGGIVGINEVEVVGLKSLATSMLHEGMEEGSQEYIDALLRLGLWGEKTDFTELSQNAFISSIYGSITAGVMNGSSLAVNKAINIGVNQSIENQVKQEMQSKIDQIIEKEPVLGAVPPFLNKGMHTFTTENTQQFSSSLKIKKVLKNKTILNSYGIELNYDYFNNFLFNDEQYSFLIDALEEYSIIEKNNVLEPFHKLKEIVDAKGIEIDEVTKTRFSYLDSLYETLLNENGQTILAISSIGETRNIQSQLNATVMTISTEYLLSILTDENALNNLINDYKILHSTEEQARINGAIELYEEMLNSQLAISEVMKKHYEILKNYTNIVEDFNFLLSNNNVVSFNGNQYSADYFNNYLFNDQSYANLLDEIHSNKNTRSDKINVLYAYHQLYDIINSSSNNIYLNKTIFTRLNYLNQHFYKTINYNRNIFSAFNEYGANQNAVRSLALNPKENIKVYRQCENIVKKYFPDISKQKTNHLLRSINKVGVCSYAAAINNLISKFEGNEVGFRNAFGYDLYRFENNQKVLNDELILTDLYCFINQNNENLISKKGSQYFIKEDFKQQQFLIYDDGFRVPMFNNWLIEKGIPKVIDSSLAYNGVCIYEGDETSYFDYFYKDDAGFLYGITEGVVNSYPNRIMYSLAKGETVTLSAFPTPEFGYNLYSTNPSEYNNFFGSKGGSTGHAMYVTGLTANNDIIVSSWGKEYILKIEDLKKIRVNLDELTWEGN